MNTFYKMGLFIAFLCLGNVAFAQTNTQTIPTAQPDPAVIQKLHDLQKPIDMARAGNRLDEMQKAQNIYNEYAAQHLVEARIVAEQKEQAEAAQNLSPADYDNWKSNKHNPQNR